MVTFNIEHHKEIETKMQGYYRVSNLIRVLTFVTRNEKILNRREQISLKKDSGTAVYIFNGSLKP
jgi:hypothetical protein